MNWAVLVYGKHGSCGSQRHSQRGRGLAQAAAAYIGSRAITFNAAGWSEGLNRYAKLGAEKEFTILAVIGESLTTAEMLIIPAKGETVWLERG